MTTHNKSQGDTAATVITPLPEVRVQSKQTSVSMVPDAEMCAGLGNFHTDNPTKRSFDPNKPLLGITFDDIVSMAENPESFEKGEGWWVIPRTEKTRSLKDGQEGTFYALWADFDPDPMPIPQLAKVWAQIAGKHGTLALHFSSRRATADCQKSRLFVPLKHPLSGPDWQLAAECMNDALLAAGAIPDRASEKVSQLCNLPNRGEFYQHLLTGEGAFDAMAAFAPQIAEKRAELARLEEEAKKRIEESKAKRSLRKVSGFNSPIDAFNDAYRVEEILIRNGYSQRGRDFRHPNSESGSYSARVFDNGRVKSLSPNDPLHIDDKGAHDAFGAFCVLECGGDERMATREAAKEFSVTNEMATYDLSAFEDYGPTPEADVGGDGEEQPLKPHPLAIYKDYNTEEFTLREFVFDGIMVSGMVLIAGSAGVGKSSSLVPLFARVTHLVVEDDLRPLIRRRVIYITEDSQQVEEILASMQASGEFGDTTMEELRDMFRVVDAYRLDPVTVADARKHYEPLSIPNVGYGEPDPFTGEFEESIVMAAPLVVFDTTSATIHLENESDNSKVGEAVALLKQAFRGMPTALVTHVAKAYKQKDVKDLSARGAGAWEADCHQVMYLVHDNSEHTKRWLEVKGAKHRFRHAADGIEITGKFNNITVRDVFGKKTEVGVMHGFPKISEPGKRESDKARKEEFDALNKQMEDEEKAAERRNGMLSILTKLLDVRHEVAFKEKVGNHGYITKNELPQKMTGNKQALTALADELCAQGLLQFGPIPLHLRRQGQQREGYFLPTTDLDELAKAAATLKANKEQDHE